jgi:hypothetical protein
MQILESGFWQSYTSLLDAQVPTFYGTDLFIVPWGTIFLLSFQNYFTKFLYEVQYLNHNIHLIL